MFERKKVKSEFSYNLRAMFSVPTLAVWGAAILLTVTTGPFGTFKDLALAPRALFWVIVVTVSVLVGYVSRIVAVLVAGPDKPGLFDAVAVLTMTLLLAPMVKLIGRAFEPVFVFKMAPLSMIYLYVFAVALSVFLFRRLTPGIERRSYSFVSEGGGVPIAKPLVQPRLIRRLAPDHRGAVLRITGRDHHVEVATTAGVQSLRMRLTDAISEMEPVEGYCSHRSHWIARDAIAKIERESAQKTWLVLSNGDRVPVSRKYRPGLEAAGIL